jgi:hypothetical protein
MLEICASGGRPGISYSINAHTWEERNPMEPGEYDMLFLSKDMCKGEQRGGGRDGDGDTPLATSNRKCAGVVPAEGHTTRAMTT